MTILAYIRDLKNNIIVEHWHDDDGKSIVGFTEYVQRGVTEHGQPILGIHMNRVIAKVKVAEEDINLSLDELRKKYPLPSPARPGTVPVADKT